MNRNAIFVLVGIIIIVGTGGYWYSQSAQNGGYPPVPEGQDPNDPALGGVGAPTDSSQPPQGGNTGSNTSNNGTSQPPIASVCQADIAAAQASAAGKICTEVATQFACRSASTVMYTAKNGCESNYLAEKGWLVVDPVQ